VEVKKECCYLCALIGLYARIFCNGCFCQNLIYGCHKKVENDNSVEDWKCFTTCYATEEEDVGILEEWKESVL
jgi:hypothetical protein